MSYDLECKLEDFYNDYENYIIHQELIDYDQEFKTELDFTEYLKNVIEENFYEFAYEFSNSIEIYSYSDISHIFDTYISEINEISENNRIEDTILNQIRYYYYLLLKEHIEENFDFEKMFNMLLEFDTVKEKIEEIQYKEELEENINTTQKDKVFKI